MVWSALTALSLEPKDRRKFIKLARRFGLDDAIRRIEKAAHTHKEHKAHFFWVWEDLPEEDINTLRSLVSDMPSGSWILCFYSKDGTFWNARGTAKRIKDPFELGTSEWGIHYDLKRAVSWNLWEESDSLVRRA